MCTIYVICNKITRKRMVMNTNKMKNEIIFVDDPKGKHWEEMKPQMLLMVDGKVVVTRNLTAFSRKYCDFRHITLLEV